ncbi:MAG: Ig domain protein group 1 domain protein [Thermoleophilia bacterium]|nr:Ig domain protein group 1 domain protein [Thermoleophilia bacterium]
MPLLPRLVPASLLALVLCAALAGAPVTAPAATLSVCGTCVPYSTIQAAVDAAGNGDTIDVAAGTYTGNTTISKPVYLRGPQHDVDARTRPGGAGEAVLVGGAGGPALTITKGASIDGFTVSGATTGAGIDITPDGDGTVLRNTIVTDNVGGIHADPVGTSVVERNLVTANSRPGATSGWGIFGDRGAYALVIRDNTIVSEAVGVRLLNAVGVEVADNAIAATQSAIGLAGGGGDVTVTGNVLVGPAIGLRVSGPAPSTPPEVHRNDLASVATGIRSEGPAVAAEDNWFGCNAGPGMVSCSNLAGAAAVGAVDADPWIVLEVAAAPASTTPSGTTTVQASVTRDALGRTVAGGDPLPDGTMVTFGSNAGTITATAPLVDGVATATFTAPPAAGTATVTASLGQQTVSTAVAVAAPPPPPVVTPPATTPPVAAASPVNTALPTVAGTARPPSVVHCATGTWTLSPSFTYRWSRDGIVVSSATAAAYALTIADAGAALRCEVTATVGGGAKPGVAVSAARLIGRVVQTTTIRLENARSFVRRCGTTLARACADTRASTVQVGGGLRPARANVRGTVFFEHLRGTKWVLSLSRPIVTTAGGRYVVKVPGRFISAGTWRARTIFPLIPAADGAKSTYRFFRLTP